MFIHDPNPIEMDDQPEFGLDIFSDKFILFAEIDPYNQRKITVLDENKEMVAESYYSVNRNDIVLGEMSTQVNESYRRLGVSTQLLLLRTLLAVNEWQTVDPYNADIIPRIRIYAGSDESRAENILKWVSGLTGSKWGLQLTEDSSSDDRVESKNNRSSFYYVDIYTQPARMLLELSQKIVPPEYTNIQFEKAEVTA